MKLLLAIFAIYSIICISFGSIIANPLDPEPNEEECTGKIENLNNFATICQEPLDQPAMLEILNDIVFYNVTQSQIKAYIEKNCATVSEATSCLFEAKHIVKDDRCHKFSKYSRGIFGYDIILMKTLYLCENNGKHFDDLLPNNGLMCTYGSDTYMKCFISKEIEMKENPNSLATETCINSQSHWECLNQIADCSSEKAVDAMKGIVLLYKEKFNC